MSVTLETEGHDETVAPEVATAAFRIVQEALSNTLRHAEGSRVAVSLQAGEKLVVRVTDDGVGLSARRGERRGMGLVNIRERAAGLGGRADVRDAAPVGTTVEAELPLAPVRKAGS